MSGVHVFSNGSQFMDWTSRNCDRCVKRCRDDLSPTSPCEIQNAIFQSMCGDGSFDEAMAKRMGHKNDLVQYTWRCPEFDDVPGVYCGHCLQEIKTEDELIVSEKCGRCGGKLTKATILDKADILERRAKDDKDMREAIASGLIADTQAAGGGGDGGGA